MFPKTLRFHLFSLFPVCDDQRVGVTFDALHHASGDHKLSNACHRDMRYCLVASAAKNRGTSQCKLEAIEVFAC